MLTKRYLEGLTKDKLIELVERFQEEVEELVEIIRQLEGDI